MARDLNKFFAAHRISHTRYISSVDALIERYEDVSEDELESVVNLSSCKIVKDKKGIFSRGRYFGSMFHHLHDNEHSGKHDLKENREKREPLSLESHDESDTEQENVDFEVLKDVSSCVVSFLEEGEPEPSDAETLSSTSTDSYETILSEYEDDITQGSNSQEELEFESIDKPQEEENIYDEIDGGTLEDVCDLINQDTSGDTRKSQTILSNDTYKRGHRNVDTNVGRRSDETFIIEDRQNSNVDRIYEKLQRQNNLPQYGSEKCNIPHGNINRRDYSNFCKSPPQRVNVKRVSTEYTPFSHCASKRNDSFVPEFDHRKSTFRNKHDRENSRGDINQEYKVFSPVDPRYQDKQTNVRDSLKVRSKNNFDRPEKEEFQENGEDAVIFSKRQSMEWLHRNFSQRQLSEQQGIQKNDLSPSHRKRGSSSVLNMLKSMNSEYDSPRLNRENEKSFNRNSSMKIVTPFHHRQARKMVTSNFKPSSVQQNEGFSTISNETEYDSVQEDNRSSKKDSGFSTLHDESLTVDTPLYEEVQETLTSENLDSFNKSLAEQSSFVNVSMNCSHSNVEEKTDKVEKWLHNVSVEMEKESETTIDRKVDRISQEMCRNVHSVNSVMDREMESNLEVIRHRHNSADVPKNTGVILDTVVSKSCQPLWKSPSLNRNIGQEVKSDFLSENNRTSGHCDRHILKGHRNLSSDVNDRLQKERIADILSLFGRRNVNNPGSDKIKQRHSGVSGKRLIESPGDRVNIGKEIDEMPTPPKSRKLNLNVHNRFEDRNLHNSNECVKMLGYKRCNNGSENYPERIGKNGYPMEKQEMIAYMMPRGFLKKSKHDKTDKKQADRKNGHDKHVNDDFFEEIKSPHFLPGQKCSNTNERNEFAHVVKEKVQEKMKSPNNNGRSFQQGTEITLVDQRRVHTPHTYQASQYEVNQSYIRKLKMNAEVKGQECGFENHHDEIDDDRNQYFDGEVGFDNQQYIGKNRRQRQSHRKETRDREESFEFDDLYADIEEYKEFTEEDDGDDREYSSCGSFQAQLYDQRQRGDYYDGPERGMCHEHGRSNSRSGYSSQKIKERRRSRDRVEHRDMRNTFPHMLQVDKTVYRNGSFGNNGHSLNRSSGKERYSQHNIQGSMSDVLHDEKEESEIGAVSPRSEIHRYHMECHLGSPHWQRSRHYRSNSIEAGIPQRDRYSSASFRGTTSSFSQDIRRNQPDTEFMSPSRQDRGDFNSPVVDRANHTRMSKVDEYSPSASLAKMRLNTPKSKLEAQRKMSRSNSREGNHETNDNYQKVNSTRNDDLNDFCVDRNEMNERDFLNVSLRKNTHNFQNLEKETNEYFNVPYTAECQDYSSQRFVSLDQLSGMPLQLRIQQVESDHITTQRHAKGRPKNGNRDCSNEYISEDFSRDSLYTKDRHSKKSELEMEKSSNVYHKYCEIMNEKDQSLGKTEGDENTPEANVKQKMERKPYSEPRMRKSLFSPVSANFRPVATSEIKKRLPQSCQDLDVFKTPMSPPVVARNKVKTHNKENENIVNKVSEQTHVQRPVSDGNARCRDRLLGDESGQRKLTPSQYMQSTPIKPGMHFTLNTTMSTIMGSDETEVNNDGNEEIILI